jgi:hypothetical protein
LVFHLVNAVVAPPTVGILASQWGQKRLNNRISTILPFGKCPATSGWNNSFCLLGNTTSKHRFAAASASMARLLIVFALLLPAYSPRQL